MADDFVTADVSINLPGFKRYQRAVSSEGSNNPHFAKMFRQWGMRYRSAMQIRFDKFSKGGGWPPLSERTKKARRKGKRAAPIANILRDTGLAFAALTPVFNNLPGQYEKFVTWGIEVGFGGPGRHKKARVSLADIMGFHQVGAGFLPVRQTIVQPPSETIRSMATDAQRALDAIGDE